MNYYIALDRLDEAKATFDQAMASKLDGSNLRECRYYLAFLHNDTAAMQQQVEWAKGRAGGEDLLLSSQADTEAYHGRLAKARESRQRAVQFAKQADAAETAALWQAEAALTEAESGNTAQAHQNVAAALALVPGRDVRIVAALALSRARDSTQSQKLVDKISQEFPPDTMVQNYWLPTIRGTLEIGRNNWERAIELLKVTSSYELSEPLPFQSLGTMYPVYVRGQAYLLAHNGSAAAAEFQKLLDHPGIVVNFLTGALAHLQLGRAYALSGDTAKAKTAYQDFLALWKDADPDIPILKQAKAEYAKLQ